MGRRAGDVLYHDAPFFTPLRREAIWRQLLQTKERVDSIPQWWRVKTEQWAETFQASRDFSYQMAMSSPAGLGAASVRIRLR